MYRFTITLPEETVAVLDKERDRTGRSRSRLIDDAVTQVFGDVYDLTSMSHEQVVALLENLLAQERRKAEA